MNKKAQNLNVTTIIIVILAILVLVILALSFTGGMTELWKKIVGTKQITFDQSDINLAIQKCQMYCEQSDYGSYCRFTAEPLKEEGKEIGPRCWEVAKLYDKKAYCYDGDTKINEEWCKKPENGYLQ
ncbi:hypothetical protein CO154_01485 [Candidatus Pacearchaeota archaeon CG_4_9_14_3_um_filter_31_7]|nr:MAG: hypothetical protein AUJ10_03210 [Candidatus Pacearchaeota archaeon CG1_02_31_27]PIN92414.1 MAG: hypothetical protein COU55_01265 [Candidatus Pacearchaeota archaeon CG10_big_fil_rev_8_21_14_0_10_31_59]PIZ80999.1 MAG: hypothetical protein COX99_00965 [Candidatus Pacearchaeota archaeon CG_4_10_14_0_2_um_filter_31_10]PJA70728.1 MAG: hypothetical protein CO154_01485 [Candidatus Pacearchaeota archaeon CG_4_9_14_3_um_filter_31_7]